MNFFKAFCLLTFIFVSTSISAQTVITITEDTVFDSTMEFDEDTIIQGVGNPTVTFNGMPKFSLTNCTVLIKDLKLASRSDWGTIDDNSLLEWYNVGMVGYICQNVNLPPTRLDGSVRPVR